MATDPFDPQDPSSPDDQRAQELTREALRELAQSPALARLTSTLAGPRERRLEEALAALRAEARRAREYREAATAAPPTFAVDTQVPGDDATWPTTQPEANAASDADASSAATTSSAFEPAQNAEPGPVPAPRERRSSPRGSRGSHPLRPAPSAKPTPTPDEASPIADVCLFIEGAYPYVSGGVSNWAHDLITAHADLRFHVVALVADDQTRHRRYALPPNVVGLHHIVLQPTLDETPSHDDPDARALLTALHPPMQALLEGGGVRELRQVLKVMRRHAHTVSMAQLLNSEAAFDVVQRMFERQVPHTAFLRYFWSWRSLVGGLYAVLLAKLPRAHVYHAVSTGYAGLAMARATLESGNPGLLTEHGIYTVERRVELALSPWLAPESPPTLALDDRPIELRDVWMQAFVAYSHVAYEAATRIVTLFEGNQTLQEGDGAKFDRMMVIPNGVNVKRLRRIERRQTSDRRPTVAMIGRVVPIKDVKTFIRAAALLRDLVPNVRIYVIGNRDEDPQYARECQAMATHLGLSQCLSFKGHMSTERVLPHIDVLALTSLSEAQPLVMLEAGAAGIPCVVTDVGACAEIIEGRRHEYPRLPPGGIVTPLTDPQATAQALARLLRDQALHARSGRALRERVRRYYNQKMVDKAYRDLYGQMLTQALDGPDAPQGSDDPPTVVSSSSASTGSSTGFLDTDSAWHRQVTPPAPNPGDGSVRRTLIAP